MVAVTLHVDSSLGEQELVKKFFVYNLVFTYQYESAIARGDWICATLEVEGVAVGGWKNLDTCNLYGGTQISIPILAPQGLHVGTILLTNDKGETLTPRRTVIFEVPNLDKAHYVCEAYAGECTY